MTNQIKQAVLALKAAEDFESQRNFQKAIAEYENAIRLYEELTTDATQTKEFKESVKTTIKAFERQVKVLKLRLQAPKKSFTA